MKRTLAMLGAAAALVVALKACSSDPDPDPEAGRSPAAPGADCDPALDEAFTAASACQSPGR